MRVPDHKKILKITMGLWCSREREEYREEEVWWWKEEDVDGGASW